MPYDLENPEGSPLDMFEEMAEEKGWPYTRHDANSLTLSVKGQSSSYDIELEWQDEFSAVLLGCHINAPVKTEYRPASAEILQKVNENLWLGHFDLCNDTHRPMFRYTLMLRLVPPAVAIEMITDTIELAMAECDRFYMPFSMLSAGDVRLQEVLHAAIFETVGEA